MAGAVDSSTDQWNGLSRTGVVQPIPHHADLAALSREEAARLRSTPLVRRLATQHGVRLADVPGAGFAGRVRREDLLTYLERRRNAVGLPAVGPAPPIDLPAGAPTTRQTPPPAPARRQRVPTATTIVEIDLTSIVQLVQRGAAGTRRRSAVQRDCLPYLIKCAVDSLPDHRMVNAVFRPDGVFVYRDVHLAVTLPAASGNGGELSAHARLVRHAERLSVDQLAGALADGGASGSDAASAPHAAAGCTLRVECADGGGPTLSRSDLVAPHAAILSFGAMAKRLVVLTDADANDSIAVRWLACAGLSFDHRVVDVLTACRFLAGVKERAERASGS